MPVAVSSTPTPSGGLKAYYQAKIEAAEIEINQKTQNLRRLEAQRNALNARGMPWALTSLTATHEIIPKYGYCGKNCNCSTNLVAT